MDLVKTVEMEIMRMSDDERYHAWKDFDYLLFEYIHRVETNDDLLKIPPREKIARACLFFLISLGKDRFKKEDNDVIMEICNFSRGISLIQIAPKINKLYQAIIELDNEEHEIEAQRPLSEDEIPF